MICQKCSSIPFGNPKWWEKLEHYTLFVELEASAKSGCELCRLFQKVLLERHVQEDQQTLVEAESYHRSLDLEMEPWLHFQDTKTTSTDVLDEPIHLHPYIFQVQPILRHTSKGRGALGVVFARSCKYHGENARRLYPARDPSLDVALSKPECSASENMGSFVEEDLRPNLLQFNIVGRQISSLPDCKLAGTWIKDCTSNHVSCSQPSNPQLPSRVLELDAFADTTDLRLMISAGRLGKYATLSHCWGSEQPMKLTEATLNYLRKRIDFTHLPRTFQDAVMVSRLLGLKYLWIDSLCIIQDSPRDWEEQCSKMAQIYQESIVTLAGPAASSCHSGFLHARPKLDEVRLTMSRDTGPIGISVSQPWKTKGNPLNIEPEIDSPLAKRGWVLQERLLSRRVLYFGSSRMYFECFQHVCIEESYYPVTWHRQLEKKSIAKLKSRSESFVYWLEIVTTYSRTSLTKRTDKLPALSGLASEIQKATKAKYLAGIWLEDILRGLMWYIPQSSWDETRSTPASRNYIAPSWSWASTNQVIGYTPSWLFDFEQKDIAVIEAETSSVSLDPFGAVADGFILLTGRLKSATVRERTLEEQSKVPSDVGNFCFQLDHPLLDTTILYLPDDPSSVTISGITVTFLYIGSHGPWHSETGHSAALGLQQIGENPQEYKRIGLASTSTPDSTKVFQRLFEEEESTLLRLV